VVFGLNSALGGGFRWDAAARTIGTNERSLNGGLRFSVEGGSFQNFRDLFAWQTLPSVADFTLAVQQAFNAWTIVDPATSLGTAISFVDDIANTAVIGTQVFGSFVNGVTQNGAEIDLFGDNAGDNGTRAVTAFFAVGGNVTLTSGTANYGGADGGGAISGADIQINSNPGAVYTLDDFRRLLTHEIGHALGLGDVEDFNNLGFIDDNYSAANAQATLNNSWALLVNPLDPEQSTGLTKFAAGVVANNNPGIDSPGVDILMESEGLGIAPGNPVTNLFPLTNDDFGTRQFLYPSLEGTPEPSALAFAAVGLAGVFVSRRRARS
jgi:MYXO-CTERM domain-containing protein